MDAFHRDRARPDGLGVYCAECHNAETKRSLLKLRLSVLDLLGGRFCVKCSIDDVRVLVIDHVNGGGSQHRRDAVSSYSVYRYVQKHPDEFQVLCFNCNHLARLERGESGKTYAARVAESAPLQSEAEPRRWARDFDACQGCGTAELKHIAKGFCDPCYRALRDKERTKTRDSVVVHPSRLVERHVGVGAGNAPAQREALARARTPEHQAAAGRAKKGIPNPKVAESRRGTKKGYRDDGSSYWYRPEGA